MGRRSRLKAERRAHRRTLTGEREERCGQFNGEERCPHEAKREILTRDYQVIRACPSHYALARAQDLVIRWRALTDPPFTPQELERPPEPAPKTLEETLALTEVREVEPGVVAGMKDGRRIVIDRREKDEDPEVHDLPAELDISAILAPRVALPPCMPVLPSRPSVLPKVPPC